LLLYAFKYLNSILRTHKGIEARIFLTKGEHFVFSCTNYESELFEASPEMSSYFNYCKLLFQKLPRETGQFSLDASDNYNITIEPLLCSLGSELGMTANPLFAQLCVDPSVDDMPIVYVQNPNSLFNVTGSLAIRQIRFSGVNTLASPADTFFSNKLLPI